ncbi:MAG: PEP-CTERM sorting domain-containing protein [Planctomycetota bacterium]|jgi:hypothetical protein
MKKPFAILIFVLFLAFACPARANLWLAVNDVWSPPASEIIASPSDTLVLSIWGDGADTNPTGWLLVQGPGSINGHLMVYGGSATVYKDLEELAEENSMTPEQYLAAWQDQLDMPDLADMSGWELVDLVPTPLPTEGLLIDQIIFHCQGAGDAVVTLIDANLQDVYDTIVVHIPEPLTVALVGLGGLFLMRRRR